MENCEMLSSCSTLGETLSQLSLTVTPVVYILYTLNVSPLDFSASFSFPSLREGTEYNGYFIDLLGRDLLF